MSEEVIENPDVGEHEDNDVKNERQKVFDLMNSPSSVQEAPVILLQVLRQFPFFPAKKKKSTFFF